MLTIYYVLFYVSIHISRKILYNIYVSEYNICICLIIYLNIIYTMVYYIIIYSYYYYIN